mgnify:CR=1 FL=1
MSRLDGKVIVVTGGTQGLGEAIAIHAANEGAAGVVICGRQENKGRDVTSRIEEIGAAAEFVQAVSFKMTFIAKLFSKAAGIKMSPPLTVFVDQAAIGKFVPELVVELWQFFKGYIVQNS